MLELPLLLIQDDIKWIYEFFNQNQQERSKNDGRCCSIEMPIMSSNLPVLSDKPAEFIKIENIENIYDIHGYISNLINERQKLKEQGSESIEVEHRFIDFSFLIIGKKIRNLDVEFNLDDQELAELFLQENDNNKELYKQQFVQQLINFQFPLSRKYFLCLFFLYSLGFFLPLQLSIMNNSEPDFEGVAFYVICTLT